MPTLASISANSIDLETITTLAGILNTTASDVETTNQIMENQLVYNLATEITGEDIANYTDGVIYTSQQTELSFYANGIDATIRSTLDIMTSPNLTDGNFALSAQFVDSEETQYDSVSNPIGNGISKNISVIAPTISLYESFININSSENNGPFYDNGNFIAYFDSENENSNISRALNSRYATTDNSDPLTVEEHYTFNQSYSCANDINKYFILDANEGEPIPQDLSSTFQASLNGFTVSSFPNVINSNEMFGTYKIEQVQDNVYLAIGINNESDESGSQQEQYDIAHLPVFNSTLGLNGDNSIPQSLSYEQYVSIFNTSQEPWSIVSGNQMQVYISESEYSGYFFHDRDNHNFPLLNTDEDATLTLDSTDLTDNYNYMRNYVSGVHKIEFSSASLNISPDGNGSSTNESDGLFSLSNGRECLTEEEYQDGQILLNINSIGSRVVENQNGGETQSNIVAANIVYNQEEGGSGRQGIPNDLQTNSYVKYVNKLLLKNPENDVNYALSNGASVNLFNGYQIVNDVFQNSEIQFTNETTVDDNTVEIFKINTNQQFITEATNTLIANATENTPETPYIEYSVNGSIENFNALVTSQSLNRMQINLALKPLSELSIYNDAMNAGWAVRNHYNPDGGPRVYLQTVSSSSNSAQPPGQDPDDPNPTYPITWPNLYANTLYYNQQTNNTNEVYYMTHTPDARLDYSIAIIPVPNWKREAVNASFNYNISVMWGVYPEDVSSNKIKYQTPTPKTISNYTDLSIVPTSEYTYSGPTFNRTVKLCKIIYTTELEIDSPLYLIPYDSLTIKTPRITITYTYYQLKYGATNANINTYTNLAASYLQHVNGTGNNSIDYAKVSYTIQGQSANTPLIMTGSLNGDDFKEFALNVSVINDDDSVVQISDNIKATAFYGDTVSLNLSQQFDPNPLISDISITLQGTGRNPIPLVNPTGYKVRIVVDPAVSYNVLNYTRSIADLADNTLSVRDGYASITDWNESSHDVEVNTDENGTTVLSIIDLNTLSVLATLTTVDWRYINTQVFITLCNNDIWNINKYIGSSSYDNTHTSFVSPINYEVVQGNNTFSNTFSPDTGVYVVGNGTTLSAATITEVGYVFDFELKQDYISVSLVGNANPTLYPIDNLTYQYVDGGSYSRILTLQNYRGYYGVQSVNQVYTLQRDQLTATFSVTNGSAVVAQTFNVYKDYTVSVNDLIDLSDDSIGGIGLRITFLESMLTPEDIDSFIVYPLGDSVIINLVNDNYTAFTPITINKSLADYDIYTFSGSNFNSTGGPLKINSARLKIRNEVFPNTTANYNVHINSNGANIKFLNNYLGNPENANWNDATVLFSSQYAGWLLSNDDGGYGYGTANNYYNSNLQIVRTPNTVYIPSISYIVVVPPYLKFTQCGNFVEETDLPYDPSVNAADNLVYRYLPVNIDNNVYYPFNTNVFWYSDEDTEIVVSSDTNKTNNIQFQRDNLKRIVDYVVNPDEGQNKIVVNGNFYEIQLYLGLKDSPSPQFLATLFNDTSNKLLNLPQQPNDGYLSLADSINNNSGVIVSYLQELVSYQNGITLENIFADVNVGSISNNITFEIDSFFLKLDSNNNKLDLRILQGVNMSLYTRKLVMDEHGNMNVNVYKYRPISSGNSQASLVNTILYNSREVKSIQVPSISAEPNVVPNWNNRLQAIAYETIENNEWVPDIAFNDSNTTTFVSVVNLTTESSATNQPLIFACESNGIQKITLVNKQPLLRIVNKIGMPIVEIDADGIIKTANLSTNSLILNPIPSEAINSSLSNYPLYSVLGNSLDTVI